MVLLLIVSIVPTILLLAYIYHKDSYEKEPAMLLFQLFLLGILSCIPAVIFEVAGDSILGHFYTENTLIYNFIDTFFIVAFVEEGGKYIFTVMRTWNSPSFNYKFDGIVYAVFTSLGFATLENIIYVLQYGLGTGILRAFLSVPGHAIDAVFMGYFYGIAKQNSVRNNKGRSLVNMFLAFVVPMCIHGFYDFCLTTGGWWVLLFFAFVIIVDVLAVIRINKSSKENARLAEISMANNIKYAGTFYQNNINPAPIGNVYQNNVNPAPMGNVYQNNMNPMPAGNTNTNNMKMKKCIFCVKCGSENDMNSFYCYRCGNKLLF